MSDTADLVKNIVVGIISGGTTAGGAFFATQGSLRKKIEAVETQLGSSNDPKSGLHLTVANLEELVKRLRKDLDEFEDSPPAWVVRLMSRTRTQSGLNLEIVEGLEDKIRMVVDRVKRIEDAFDSRYVSRSEYENDDRERAKEVAKLREEMQITNGMLRGMITMLGMKIPENKSRPPGL